MRRFGLYVSIVYRAQQGPRHCVFGISFAGVRSDKNWVTGFWCGDHVVVDVRFFVYVRSREEIVRVVLCVFEPREPQKTHCRLKTKDFLHMLPLAYTYVYIVLFSEWRSFLEKQQKY